MSTNAFKLEILSQAPTSESLSAVASGQLAAILVKNAMPAAHAAEFTKRFWIDERRVARPDGVGGFYIGAYHYAKPQDAYWADVESTEGVLDSLFQGLVDPRVSVQHAIEGMRSHPNLRRAKWGDRVASRGRALSWTSGGMYLLAPHDDIGQLHDPQQSTFEIQQVATNVVIAVNIYPLVPGDGGALRVWNVRPTDDDRRAFGIESTGFPYPLNVLDGIEYFDIPVETGSMAIMNGGLVHAVVGYDRELAETSRRLLVNLFYGEIASNQFVYWV